MWLRRRWLLEKLNVVAAVVLLQQHLSGSRCLKSDYPPAEDLTQETFVKVHQSLGGFRGESQLSTWIYRIAINTALDKMRHPSFQRVKQISISDEIEEANISNGDIFSEGQNYETR